MWPGSAERLLATCLFAGGDYHVRVFAKGDYLQSKPDPPRSVVGSQMVGKARITVRAKTTRRKCLGARNKLGTGRERSCYAIDSLHRRRVTNVVRAVLGNARAARSSPFALARGSLASHVPQHRAPSITRAQAM